MEKFDAVVAGGGVGGALFAREAAKLGLNVALIEKKTGDALGHDWWDVIEKSIFDKVDVPHPSGSELLNPPDVTTVISPLEGVGIPATNPYCHVVDRKPLARRLLNYAASYGASVFEGWSIVEPVVEGEAVKGVKAVSPDGEARVFEAPVTVDATGYGAVLRKKIPFAADFEKELAPSDTFICYREIRNKTQTNVKGANVYFGKDYGVAWVNYEQDGLVDLFGGAVNLAGCRKPKEIVDELAGRHEGIGDKVMRAGYGQPIPVRRCLDSFVADGFMLVGDAAGQCNPMDGSGMASSMWGGVLAARTAKEAIRNGDVSRKGLWPYNYEYKSTKGAEFAFLYILQKFFLSSDLKDLELLFTRRLMNPEEFWGNGLSVNLGALKRVEYALKLADRPAFLLRLAQSVSAAEKIMELHKRFPRELDRREFEGWRKSVNRIVGSVNRRKS